MNADKLIVIDIGGTSIKYGLWNQREMAISNKNNVKTPDTLEEFYGIIKYIADKFKGDDVQGIGLSIPGAVNQASGIINGVSALPYIHGFPILKELESLTGYKMTMENDASCSALAELSTGAARDFDNIVFLVIGTGVGGAIVIDDHIVYGSHLYGGEFGMMLVQNGQTLSSLGTAVHLAERYNQRYQTNFSGEHILKLADAGDRGAIKEAQVMYDSLAQAIYNLQFVTDPEAIIIGGGVSANNNFLANLKATVSKLMSAWGDTPVLPQIKPAKYRNDANLIGAAYNFYNQIN
ncbi:ROK family protein [Companilactobacillus nantensis]|uniref:Transcriptional regulator sugar kinase n=1 Tax=Companilactobacillus nantensis DSM 16982 TaxID=1423774 RepID=A0A0R1WU76_9LACO|nr:ROK family protein [Companilactobacillus nantensis]KRM18627.1 transcriptional regulator sugar kinase [Companilactobacillus nantensis DSM 16982]GEO63187.1 N-acetylmannosamine kinase [Companilactobacillus nantensis]